MNRLIYTMMFASLFLISGCSPKEEELVTEDSIVLTSSQETVDYTAQTIALTVTSSGEWALEKCAYDWVTPSAMRGTNGAAVEFNVEENDKS